MWLHSFCPANEKVFLLTLTPPGSETSNKFESTKRICSNTTFQDGKNPYLEGTSEAQRLASKTRSKRRLLYNSYPLKSQDVSPPRENLQVQLSPLGLSSAQWVFTTTLKPVSALLQKLGVRMLVYIDDILVLAESKQMLEDQVSGLAYLLECLSFLVNAKKSRLQPNQSIEFLGIVVDTLAKALKLPGEKWKKICAKAGRLLRPLFLGTKSRFE